MTPAKYRWGRGGFKVQELGGFTLTQFIIEQTQHESSSIGKETRECNTTKVCQYYRIGSRVPRRVLTAFLVLRGVSPLTRATEFDDFGAGLAIACFFNSSCSSNIVGQKCNVSALGRTRHAIHNVFFLTTTRSTLAFAASRFSSVLPSSWRPWQP